MPKPRRAILSPPGELIVRFAFLMIPFGADWMGEGDEVRKAIGDARARRR